MNSQDSRDRRDNLPLGSVVLLLAALWLALLPACTLSTTGTESAPRETTRPAVGASVDARLSVAWVHNGDLTIWRSGDQYPRRIATGGVLRPYIAPDGAHVAYLRGPGGDPRALWISDTPGANERQLVDVSQAGAGDPTRRIEQVVWSPDAQTLYVSTRTGIGNAAQPVDDLWRVEIASGTVEQVLAAGMGGAITLSPDGSSIALAAPGQVAVYDVTTAMHRTLLEFTPVADADDARWTPELRWLPDGSALRTAIPDPGVTNGAGNVTLWALPVAGEAARLGAVVADGAGLPTYSADGAWIAYLARRDASVEADGGERALVVARGDGAAPEAYAVGEAGSLSGARWAPSGARFTYRTGDALWIGGPGGTPTRYPAEDAPVRGLQWADADTLVFLTPVSDQDDETDPVELRYGLLDVPRAPDTIAALDAPLDAFDALLPGAGS